MLHTNAPSIVPELMKGFHEAGYGKRDTGRVDLPDGVVPVWLVRVGHVEVYEVLSPGLGHAPCQAVGQVPVRVYDAQTPTVVNVLQGQGLQHCGLAYPGTTNDVQVRKTVLLLDSEFPVRKAAIGPAEV